MTNKGLNNIKLGVFSIAGLLFLVLLLYMIGRNQNLFGSTYVLKSRFENTQGLVGGNNVRFAGIQAGTVKKVTILSDTVIEVEFYIDKKMNSVIRKNAVASIATDGLVGNKVVNILPSKQPAELAVEGDILPSKKMINTDNILETLDKTTNDIYIIAGNLKTATSRINSSEALWSLLNDKSIPAGIRRSVVNIQHATGKAGDMVSNFNSILDDIKSGKGSVGALLTDSSFAKNLNEAVVKIKTVGVRADSLSGEISMLVAGIRDDINNGKGTVNALFKDSMLVVKLNASLGNIQKGTDGFNQNMEALKHSFLFRGYFRKLEKQKEKQKKQNVVAQ